MALQYVLDAPVEALDHTVGLRRFRWRKAVLYAQIGAERIELVLTRGCALAQAKETVCELFSIVGQNGADADWAGPLQVAQKPARIGRCLAVVDTNKDPAGRSIDGHEEVTAAALIGHLGQVFHVDVDIAGLIRFEGAVLGADVLGLEAAQVAHAVPTQTAVQP